MGQIFLSHSTNDDAFVRRLQQSLRDLGQDVWIDSRQLRGGDPLWQDIRRAIEEAEAYIVLISPSGLQSSWVAKELRHALEVQNQRGKEAYPVIPVSLDGTKLGVLEIAFDEPPLYIPISSAAGGVEAALDSILVALGKRAPADPAPTPQPPAEQIEELVLELTDLRLEHLQDGVRHATARARQVYVPATPGQRAVASTQSWRFIAPLGPIEAEDLRWYLEKYAVWPGDPFRTRAEKIERSLVAWGKLLHDAAMPAGPTANVQRAWARIDAHVGRRFSVQVDAACELGAPETDVAAACEAATLLLGLPWELLHDGDSFLFQGAKPTRVRRRLPNTLPLDIAVVEPPIRVLLICARPETDACSYIDHRASALPLVDAMEELPGLVELRILAPPTLPALREALDRSYREGEPYHVIHFDGHGVYNRRVGLGGLCFEHSDDADKLTHRRHEIIYTDQLGPLLRDHRVPLVFIDACQTAEADQASESVASELLRQGVASVVAMSHSVLVETARRFVTAFYGVLARGDRVGAAMLEGQRHLKEDTLRGLIFGAGELRLEDWFVPVLFQEKEDPQLFRQTPPQQTREDFQAALRSRLGKLPTEPSTGFVGRSRDLLALERLLRRERYAVLRGQGGEGKTALAAEFARWMVRSHRFRRAAFASVESHGTTKAVLDALGRQLVGATYSVATFDRLEHAELPVVRALREQPTLLVIDNLESVLPPPYHADEAPELLAEEDRSELAAILALCERLHRHGETRLVFTSREALPAPFDGEINRHELHRLHRDDAVKLIERVVNEGATMGVADAEREAIEDLVEAVHGHARTLALLAPSLRRDGVTATREALVELMADMDRRFPGQREKSLFASVELSLRRLSPEDRQRARVLGVFQGGVSLVALCLMMEWEMTQAMTLGRLLVDVGVATPIGYGHYSLDPALCPYLRNQLDDAERETLTARWIAAMRSYVAFIYDEQDKNAELASTLTLLELPNLLALLAQLALAENADATIEVATVLQQLLQRVGGAGVVAQVGKVRDAAVTALTATWSHARFEAERCRIEEEFAVGRLQEALTGAQAQLQRARVAGAKAYAGADYDLAMACWQLSRILRTIGDAQQALSCIDLARQHFETVEGARGARRAGAVCLTERGSCLRLLGRFDESAAALEESIREAREQQDQHLLAVATGELGIVRGDQRRYDDALNAYALSRELFARLGEHSSIAKVWHQIGVTYRGAGQPDAAEDAYRHSLAISVRLGDTSIQARTLIELGNLHNELDHLEEAGSQYRRCADLCVALGDVNLEGTSRNNLANTLRKLRRWDEARQEIRRAIECKEPFGHAAAPWKSWSIMADIEAEAGHASLAVQAGTRARACYLAYRRDGGENHDDDGRVALAVTEQLLTGDTAGAITALDELLADAELSADLRPFVVALREIATGSRDRHLADAPKLHYRSATELLLLIEALEVAEVGGSPGPRDMSGAV